MRINLIFKRLVKADDQENNNIKNTMELYEELMENSGDFLFSVTESGRLLLVINTLKTLFASLMSKPKR